MRKKADKFTHALSAAIGFILVTIVFSGCARDGSRTLMDNLLASPAERLDQRQMKRASNEYVRRLSEGAPSSANSLGQSEIKGTEVQNSQVSWTTSWEEAKAESARTGKLILADFTGSTWCHYCVKLKKEVFDQHDFKNWAKDNVVLLELDYPRDNSQTQSIRAQNASLKSKYAISRYPTVLLLDSEGNVQAKMGYQNGQSPADWVQVAESRLHQNAMSTRYVAEGVNGNSMIR